MVTETRMKLVLFALMGVMMASLFLGTVSGAASGSTGSYLAGSGGEQADISSMGHPRLWLRADDLPRLRSWANESNPIYRDGLAMLAEEAKAEMDAGCVPDGDNGGNSWEQYPCEMYAELFAFMSLVSDDPAERDDYARRARILLMHVMNQSIPGALDGEPFRDHGFATDDRSRWWGEGFALTVDWIYPYLSTDDKVTIREVFLRWCDENTYAETTNYNHPEPVGVVNDPVLIKDSIRVRWAANNYYTAHMRNIGLMAMALDPCDDPDNRLGGYLRNATGAWLYVVDHLYRNDGRGGLSPEGWEYGHQSTGYWAQFLLALHTAGQDDPAIWGPQVVLDNNSFWDDTVSAYLHSLSPATVTHPWLGEVYQPAWYGDGQNYWACDFIGVFGPLGLYDHATGKTTRLAALRWIQTNTAPGGADRLVEERVRDADIFRDAILYFMLFDPGDAPPLDPRPAQPLTFYAQGIGRLFARTGWDPGATWFTYTLGWNSMDHQQGDGNQFEFYRQGEWLTKERTGYGYNIACSDYHNTLALENDRPHHHDPSDYRHIIWQRGSQWLYGLSSAAGQILAHSSGEGYLYALGDATGLYNSNYEGSTDIIHASRSIIWLKPDHIIVYDRATSQTAGRFKRFWLQLPAQAVVSGNRTTMTTATGQQLFITTLLPAGAVITSEPAEPLDGEPANEEPMQYRLRIEPAETSQDIRFLHVLEGADSGTPADTMTLVQHGNGTPFTGASVNDNIVLFPVDPSATFTSLTYTAPLNITNHLITGLSPGGGYDVVTETSGVDLQVTITPGTAYHADSGGVLAWGKESKGDLNCDGQITVADAIIALKMAVRGEHNENADMNGDGQVTALDALLILQAAGGRIEL